MNKEEVENMSLEEQVAYHQGYIDGIKRAMEILKDRGNLVDDL